MEIIVLLKL